jgi:hypothetical protein
MAESLFLFILALAIGKIVPDKFDIIGSDCTCRSFRHHVLAEECMTEKESPFACDMNAIAPDQRGATPRHNRKPLWLR